MSVTCILQKRINLSGESDLIGFSTNFHTSIVMKTKTVCHSPFSRGLSDACVALSCRIGFNRDDSRVMRGVFVDHVEFLSNDLYE